MAYKTARAVSTRRGMRIFGISVFALHSHTMASRRAVVVLRPAANCTGPRLLRADFAHSAQYTTRALSSQASRPRKLAQQQQQNVRYASSGAGKGQLGKTDLYELHSKYGAKFVPFGGYSMPVQYSDLSIVDSHNWTRDKASLFDVGHM
jgi:aminomethyltransferase